MMTEKATIIITEQDAQGMSHELHEVHTAHYRRQQRSFAVMA